MGGVKYINNRHYYLVDMVVCLLNLFSLLLYLIIIYLLLLFFLHPLTCALDCDPTQTLVKFDAYAGKLQPMPATRNGLFFYK